jgi:hypothetical protein
MSPWARPVLALWARGTGLLALGSRGLERSWPPGPEGRNGTDRPPVNWPPASTLLSKDENGGRRLSKESSGPNHGGSQPGAVGGTWASPGRPIALLTF